MSRMLKTKVLPFFCSVLLCLSACAKGAEQPESAPAEQEEAVSETAAETAEPAVELNLPDASSPQWTMLLYLCGTDLESGNEFASNNLKEILAAQSSEDVNVAIETGGTRTWHTDGIASDKLQRFHVENGEMVLVEEQDMKPMSESDVLKDFIVWGAEHYPAQKTMLVLWDHGGGPLSGMCIDEYTGESLSLRDLRNAVVGANVPLEVIGLDACLMSSLETAEIFQGYAHYMIASEESVPGMGWEYATFLNTLAEHPEYNGEEIGRTVIDAFMNKCIEESAADTATMSLTDLAKIPALSAAFRKLSSELVLSTSDVEQMKRISQNARRCENYGNNNEAEGYSGLVDLGDLLENNKDDLRSTEEAQKALRDAVLYEKHGDYRSRASGLSVYYPLAPGESDAEIFQSVSDNTAYAEYIAIVGNTYDSEEWENAWRDSVKTEVKPGVYDNYFDSGIGEGGYAYNDNEEVISSLQNLQPALPSHVSVEYEASVTEDGYFQVKIVNGIEAVTSVTFNLYMNGDDNTLLLFGSDDDIIYDEETSTYRDNFRGVWLSIAGNPVYCELVDEAEKYNMYSVPIMMGDDVKYLRIVLNFDSNTYTLAGVYGGFDSHVGMPMRNTETLHPGDQISFLSYSYDLTKENENGQPESSTVILSEITWTGNETIEEAPLPDGDYTYSFAIRDVFGKVTYTEYAVFRLENGNISLAD